MDGICIIHIRETDRGRRIRRRCDLFTFNPRTCQSSENVLDYRSAPYVAFSACDVIDFMRIILGHTKYKSKHCFRTDYRKELSLSVSHSSHFCLCWFKIFSMSLYFSHFFRLPVYQCYFQMKNINV